jgi:hypothetical protein
MPLSSSSSVVFRLCIIIPRAGVSAPTQKSAASYEQPEASSQQQAARSLKPLDPMSANLIQQLE